MRLIYFADVRLPLERANGIQTMETCHALAARGHDVRLITRPDTQKPARDPYVYYGLPRHPRFAIEQAPVFGPQFARRLGYLSFALGRALGQARADVLFTRDLGVAALLARLPAGAANAARLRVPWLCAGRRRGTAAADRDGQTRERVEARTARRTRGAGLA